MPVSREEFEKMESVREFLEENRDYAFNISELAERTQENYQNVQMKVEKLKRDGLVRTKKMGRWKYVIWDGGKDE